MVPRRLPPTAFCRVFASLVLLGMGIGSPANSAQTLALEHPRLYFDVSLAPDPFALAAFDLCVLNPEARVDLERGHALGNRFLARLDLLSISDQSPSVTVAESLQVPVQPRLPSGQSKLDPTNREWRTFVVRELAESAAEKGFDGFVLAGLQDIATPEERTAVVEAIGAMDERFPDKLIVLEGANDLVPELRRAIDGLLFIGCSSRVETGKVTANEAAAVAKIDDQIRAARRMGLRPLVVDFVAPGDFAAGAVTAERLQSLGAIPFITTSPKGGVNLGPLREISRTIAVVHSGAAAGSWSAQIIHGTLEWLGCRVIYIDARDPSATSALASRDDLAGIVLDAILNLSVSEQAGLTACMAKWIAQKTPLLLAGLPWTSAETWRDAARILGIEGTGAAVEGSGNAAIRKIEKGMLARQGVLKARTIGLRDVRAPHHSRVVVSIEAQPKEGKTQVFDQAFTASWGAAWLDPLAVDAGPQIDGVRFLTEWLRPEQVAPVADTTTLNGRRILITHVSGDGFADVANAPGLPTAAEQMRDRILKRYSMPVTVAVCESDIRARSAGLDPRDAMRYEAIARSIFALPQVEAASNSFSRPAQWPVNESAARPLSSPETDSGKGGIEREIAGSLSYLHLNLLPPGKRAALMLWPAASQPSEQAVRFSRRMGVENMAVAWPSATLLTGGAQSLMPHIWNSGESAQTIASTPARRAGRLDAQAMIEAFEVSDSPRRLSPVHVPLSFQDGRDECSLAAVEQVFDWCSVRSLHGISASGYARMVRDAEQTRVLQAGPSHWVIINGGQARTLRLPASAGVPDMPHCRGVAGFSEHAGHLYIHTLGSGRVDLVLKNRAERLQLRLAEASSTVQFHNLTAGRALMQVADYRPVELQFAGIQPGATCMVSANGQPVSAMADAKGRVDFTVPPQSVIQLQVMPIDYAAMR